MKTSSELRFFSQRKLNGKYGMTIAVTLTVFACNLLLSSVSQWIVDPTTIASLAIYEIVVFLVDLLLGLLVSGQTYIYMNIVYDRQTVFSDLKQGFTEHPEKAVLLRIPFALAEMLATAPMNVYILFYLGSDDRNALFACMLVALLGFVIEVVVELFYAQVFYLLHDFPERGVTELLAASARLMDGHKMQYFLLILSYVPWLFISAFLFFIPALFVMSQMYAAQAAFYQSLVTARRDAAVSQMR